VNVPEDRSYTDQHEWVMATDGGVRIGITDYAQDALGDVVFVDLPESGREVATGDVIAEVESTKSVAEVYAPLAGIITAVNPVLADTPELINSDPYGDAWFVSIAPTAADPTDGMLDAAGYIALTE
jgi:glycine cleavage system H protein